MANQGFSFPPPPPPPPRRDVHPETPYGSYGQGNRGGSFSRGNDRGEGFRGRGRSFSRGGRGGSQSNNDPTVPQNGFVGRRERLQNYSNRGNFANGASPVVHTTQYGRPLPGYNAGSPNGTHQLNAPQKRDHATAFRGSRGGGPKPLAAPAVPSFLSNIPGLSPPTSLSTPPSITKSPTEKKSKLRTSNILGLNPSANDADSASDDEDEEAILASTAGAASQNGLTYEYRGQTATLKTPAEIAAWIAERRKRYPTAAKAEQAKKDAEEKHRKWAAQQQANLEARRQQREEHEKKNIQSLKDAALENERRKGGPYAKESEAAEKARRKTEKLVKKAEKAQKQLERAQDALRKAQSGRPSVAAKGEDQEVGNLDNGAADPSAADQASKASITSSDNSDDEDTSSSGSSSSSGSDADSAPETLTTKRTAPEQVPRRPYAPTTPSTVAALVPQGICRSMLNTGKCKYRNKCRFSHDLSKAQQIAIEQKQKTRLSQGAGKPKRKTLYEIMVEKERAEERTIVLRAIVGMAENGMLEDNTTNGDGA